MDKTSDWWNLYHLWANFMHEDTKRGSHKYDDASIAKNKYVSARVVYQEKYLEDFDPGMSPSDVGEMPKGDLK